MADRWEFPCVNRRHQLNSLPSVCYPLSRMVPFSPASVISRRHTSLFPSISLSMIYDALLWVGL